MTFPIIILFNHLFNNTEENNTKYTILYTLGYIFIAIRLSLARFSYFHHGAVSILTNFPLFGTILTAVLLWLLITNEKTQPKYE
jgi:hypothetical protein